MSNKDPKKSKKDGEGEAVPSPFSANVVDRSITTEMKESFLDYAMSVITDRALPNVHDGLKPVHRRILYAMHEKGLTSSAKFRKSAVVVGDVLGNYHPHGDVAVYDSMVQMAQDFKMRYPLIIGQGNFGNVDGDPAAAMRYTEAKMSRISNEMLRDIDKETVAWRANYDGTKNEPTVLPTATPNLILNGTLGIAVGMATNIPPHNLREISDAIIHLVDNPDAATEDLMEFVQGPDFPTGGIAYSKKDIHHASATGRGGVVVRGIAEIVETKAGQSQIVITAIPYRVNKSDLIIKIADLVREKKIEGIKGLRDESTKDIRVVIDLKGGGHPQKVLNALYKHTQLEETFHYNLVALVDGVPQTLSIKTILEEFIVHRKTVIRKRTEFDLRKAEEREHILLGLTKALDHIDAIIKLIKASKDTPDAHRSLMKEFKFSALQATAILDMRLQKLAGLERKKLEDELHEVQIFIEKCRKILANPKLILGIIKDETKEIAEKYGDDRRTIIMKQGAKVFSIEDLVPEEENALVLTAGGYVKRTKPEEFRKQKRGGVGVVDLETKEEDFVTHLVIGNTHSDVLFFTDKGKVYQIKMYDLPEGRRATRGKSLVNFLSLAEDEKVTSILMMPKDFKGGDLSLLMVTKHGVGKRVAASSFQDVRRSGLIAISLKDGDELVSASFIGKGDSAVLVTAKGQSIRFKDSDVREMGRGAAGVIAMKLGKGDIIVGAQVVQKDSKGASLLIISSNGYGKRTEIEEYKIQKRGGSGIKTSKVTPKTGDIISGTVVTEETEELVAMSQKSQVIRTEVKEIPLLGRSTQGVRIMKLREKDQIASLICF
jgi:DNA gyrase subunit A